MLWQDDVIPMDDYFDQLQDVVANWQEGTLICSKVYYKVQPNRIFAMGGSFNPKTGKKHLNARAVMDSEAYNSVMEVDWTLGQGVFIHKSIFEKVGYFDEKRFPQYSGDADFSYRVKKAGFKNLVNPNLKLLNDTETTGISHQKNMSLRNFIVSLYSIRSSTSIIKDVRFYRTHATSILAYKFLIRKNLIYIGSFVKWKVLGWFGIRRKNEEIF